MKFHLTNLIVLLVGTTTSVHAFGTALFPVSSSAQQQTFPTKDQREEIELPNFDELFGRIKQVSPLARTILDDQENTSPGFAGLPKSFGKLGNFVRPWLDLLLLDTDFVFCFGRVARS